MKIFISGASGLIGGNCLSVFETKDWEVKGSHRTFPTQRTVFFDTLEPDAADNFDIIAYCPDVIVHCGALTHVDYCENHEQESYEKNVNATGNLIKIAQSCRAKLVFLSTDYVFDGQNGPYQESATVNPLNVYGKHKWATEQLIREKITNHLIVRVTNVYGDEIRNKNFVARIVRQCQEGQNPVLKLPVDQFATPTNARDIARAIACLLEKDKTGLFHIAGTDYMNRVQLAQRVLRYFPDTKYELIPQRTTSLNQPAKRPLMGGLLAAKFLSEFPEFMFSNIDDYLSRQNRN